MYLKALEIEGFKSFPDKTVLTFGSGITAIVGPNGSGKSNISDAVRWVLGEQSTRTLRGSKMEDVIFGGTQKRGPVGYAEVSLTIDNSDGALNTEYNEVTVTRRYYRSGESEFYINRSAVRLRDIHELFMDTGLGRDGYSIIGQGRIDEILSLKSEDRREIFEEASGISKFRHRKEESERKLSATEENLVRIRDIITELEGQVGPLAKQAEQAKKFLKIRDELKDLEINVWMHTLDTIRENAIKYENDYQVAVSQFERSRALADELAAEREELSEKMRGKDVQTEQERGLLREAEGALREAEGEISLLGGSIENLRHNISRIEAELSDEENRAGGIAAQIEDRKAQIAALKAEEEALGVRIAELSGKIETAAKSTDDVSARLDGLRAKRMEHLDAAGKKRAELAAVSAGIESLKARRQEIARELEARSATLEETRKKRAQVSAAYEEAQDECDSASNRLAGFQLKEKAREERLEKLREAHRKLTITVESMEQKLRMLQDMERDMQGYSGASKAIIRAAERGELGGVHGTVSKLIRVKDEHTVAIEIALGAALHHIVAENETDTKRVISYLKSTNKGRTTVYHLGVNEHFLRADGIGKMPGFIGAACDLVKFDAKYTKVFKHLLGGIAIVDNLDNASKIANAYRRAFRIVTLDGQVINAGGSYTGGSVNETSGLLSRANEIERLEARLKTERENLVKAEAEKNEAERENQAIAYEMEVFLNDKRRAEDVLLKSGTELEHYKLLIASLNEAIDSLDDEARSVAARISAAEKTVADLEGAIAAIEGDAESCREDIEHLIKGHSELLEHKSALSDELAEMRLRTAEIRSEYSESEKALEELVTLARDMEGDRDAKVALIEEYRSKIRGIEAQIENTKKETDLRKARIDEINLRIAQIVREKLELEALRNKKEKEGEAKSQEMVNLSAEKSRLETRRDSVAGEERQIVDKLWENYELTVMGAEELRRPLESVGEAKARVSELKAERKRLGNVNVGAIEEYQRVSERFEFLSSQRDDLEKSKAELMRMIDELTREMQTIFSEQFEIINRNFSETFTEIFGGGKAELRLEDPSDILNCGIEIKVQPPGKTLRTITLLSGGERAFVAIALYFAIMKVRPTPFCVLDEIEAAMKGMLAPQFKEVIIGHAEVRETYKVSKVGTVCGCYCTDGKIQRGCEVRVLRDNIVIHEGDLASLRRFKDDVKEVATGYECGMQVEKFNDIKIGDVIECFVMEQIKL